MGRIITIDVALAAQKSGLGTLLLASAEAELKKAGCDYVSDGRFILGISPGGLRSDAEVFGTLDGYPGGHKKFYLRKKL